MNTSKIIAAAALSLLAAAGVQAETYEGVQTVNTVASRSEVAADAGLAARTAVFGEARYNGVAPALNGTTDRASVQNQAVQTARMGNIYGNQASAGRQSRFTNCRKRQFQKSFRESRPGSILLHEREFFARIVEL